MDNKADLLLGEWVNTPVGVSEYSLTEKAVNVSVGPGGVIFLSSRDGKEQIVQKLDADTCLHLSELLRQAADQLTDGPEPA